MVLPVLTSDERIALAGPSTRRTYASVIPDDDALVTTLTVNQASIPFPITQLTVTGTITNVKEGMEAIVTRSGDEIGRYRVRLDADTATLYLMELGRADPGALAYLLRPTGISNGDAITIYDRRNLYSKLPRIVFANPEASANIYEDYDKVPGIERNFPSPIGNMRVTSPRGNSRGGHFATRVQDDEAVDITATITALRWEPTTSVTYDWTVPVEWTDVSGTSSATLTGTAPIGNWKLECEITPNAGPSITIVRRVHIHGVTQNPPILIADGSFRGSRDRTGRRMTFTLLDDAIASIPHTSMVMVFNDGTWNGSPTSVPTATRIFVGWMNRIGFTVEQQTRHAMPEIVGPAGILDLLGNTSQLFEVKNLATNWQEMAYPLATFSWVVWAMMRDRAANLLQLFNYWPLSTASTVGRQPKFNVPSGSLLSQLKGIARRYHEANFGFNSGGEAFIRLHPSMTPVDDREDARDLLTPDIYTLPLDWEHGLRPTTRQVQAEAATWDGVAPLPAAVQANAPEKPEQGTSDDAWQDQIVEDEATLEVLAGLRLAMDNAPTSQVPFTIPHNRDVFEPAEMPRVEAVIPANKHPLGIEWDFFAVPSLVTENYLSDGVTDITVTLEPETSGAKGKGVPIPPPGSNVNSDLPPADEIPLQTIPDVDWGDELEYDPEEEMQLNPQPGAAAEYGRMLSATSDGRVQRLTWPSGTFTLTDVSPNSNFRALLGGDAFKLHRDASNPKQAFLVAPRAILRCSDWVTPAAPKWSAPVSLGTGIVDVDNGDGTRTVSFDFAAGGSPLGWEISVGTIDEFGPYGTFTGTNFRSELGVSGYQYITLLISFSSPVSLSELRIVGHTDDGGDHPFDQYMIYYYDGAWHRKFAPNPTVSGGSFDDTANGNSVGFDPLCTALFIDLRVFADFNPAENIWYLDRIYLTYNDNVTLYAISNDVIVSDFKSSENRDRQGYYWFVKRTEGGIDQLYLKRTFDNFHSTAEAHVARYSADIVPSIAIDPHNWKFVYVTGGDPSEDDSFVYESIDGGGSFVATTVEILAGGGQLCWNWSTQTANAPNNSQANLIIVRGLDGSDLLGRRGLGGSDVTIATSGGSGLSPQALWVLARDLDFVRMALQDDSLRLSSNAATSFSGGTAIPGGTSNVARGLDGWPTDDAFNVIWGYRTLCFSTDSDSSYTDLWPDFDTFRSATYTSDNETLIGVVIDISSHYTTPVLGGG